MPGLKANVSFIGQLPAFSQVGTEDRSDYRPVPPSDGDVTYRDRGMLGSYTPDADPYASPSDVQYAAGFGATEADLARGYCDPRIGDEPAYTFANYKDRSTLPKLSDADEDGDAMADDYAFRRRNERSRGFLTRPHIPTER